MTTPTNTDEHVRLKRLDEASQWLLCMQDPRRSDEQMNDWLRWCDADPENFAEFERLQKDWKELDALRSDGLSLTPRQKSSLLEQENAHFAGRGSPNRFMGRGRAWALAATVAGIALAAAAFHYLRTSAHPSGQQMAAVLTNRAATLPDGSKMILGVQSRVNMDFNGAKRQLDLSKGEAYFKVQHDKTRPFVVKAGELSVTAIGTAFDVRREHEQTTVTVEEGTVEVKANASTWRAEAGYQLTYSTRDRTASLASVNPTAELAWRNGELAYVREPLGSVVENLNRYSTRKIVIEDPALAALPFTGTAFAQSLDDWVAGIEQAYPITAKRTASGDIILSTIEQEP
jgi:transmembrane sensor